MIDGTQILQKVLIRLRKPSDLALPYKTILSVGQDIIAQKKLDLSLSEQNALAVTSEWFTANSNDFTLESKGLNDILLPIRVEYKADGEAIELPIVNYESPRPGTASFYGSPLRMAIRNDIEMVSQYQYRVIYETDFYDDVENKEIDLPNFFTGMLAAEWAYQLLNLVEDNSPDWLAFKSEQRSDLQMQIADWRIKWDKFVVMFRGRATIPKRTFPRRYAVLRGGRKMFRGDY